MKPSVSLLAAACPALLPAGVSASLPGDTIGVEWLLSDFPDPFAEDTHLVGGDVEILCVSPIFTSDLCRGSATDARLDVGAHSVRYEQTGSPGYRAVAFNGWRFFDLGWSVPGVILDVVIDTSIPGLDAGRVAHTADSVTINLQGLGAGDVFAEFHLIVDHALTVDSPVPLELVCGLDTLVLAVRCPRTHG